MNEYINCCCEMQAGDVRSSSERVPMLPLDNSSGEYDV